MVGCEIVYDHETRSVLCRLCADHWEIEYEPSWAYQHRPS